MKVSFIVPIYKTLPEILKKCLKSLTTQSYKDIEIICVFDGTPDSALTEIVRDFGAKQTEIDHGGACKARNAGFKLATGDIICFWDADSYIEPDTLAVWINTLNENPNADFVYSDYMFTDPRIPGHIADEFDAWTLKRYNYISTMSVIRREKVVEWDENLNGLQDWDFWRTVVENGGKGKYVPRYAFTTEIPNQESISSAIGEKKIERIKTIRNKHGDHPSLILIKAGSYRVEGANVARILDSDIFNSPFWEIDDYRLIFVVGFDKMDQNLILKLFHSEDKADRIIYWMGYDADEMFNGLSYSDVSYLSKMVNEKIKHNFCRDYNTQKILSAMGIKAKIINLPMPIGTANTKLPDTFKIMAFYDEDHEKLINAVIDSMPDVEFDRPIPGRLYPIKDYTVCFQFSKSKNLETFTRNMLLNGRYVISNVPEPYAGYIDTTGEAPKVLKSIIRKIRELKGVMEPNTKAIEYYSKLHDREEFRRKIFDLVPREKMFGIF